jgi:Fe-S-cluster containining protein
MLNPDKDFYKDGICFECQGSGNCCKSRGEYCYVYVDQADRQRLAKHLGLTLAKFTAEYCAESDGHYHLKEIARDCRFLEDKRCTVYEARPTQCRTWPFWPSLLNRLSWEHDVMTICPGAGKGRRYSAREIDDILWGSTDVPGITGTEPADA